MNHRKYFTVHLIRFCCEAYKSQCIVISVKIWMLSTQIREWKKHKVKLWASLFFYRVSRVTPTVDLCHLIYNFLSIPYTLRMRRMIDNLSFEWFNPLRNDKIYRKNSYLHVCGCDVHMRYQKCSPTAFIWGWLSIRLCFIFIRSQHIQGDEFNGMRESLLALVFLDFV